MPRKIPKAAAVAVSLSPRDVRIGVTAVIALVALVGLGALGAVAGGAPLKRAATRVVLWSSLAMLLTWAIGRVVGATV